MSKKNKRSPQLKNKMPDINALNLLKSGDYQGIISLYHESQARLDADYYYLGFAYIKLSNTVSALEQWSQIGHKPSAFMEQYQQLIGYLLSQIETLSDDDLQRIYQALNSLSDSSQDQQLNHYKTYITYYYINVLWEQQQYQTIFKILSPIPKEITTQWLAYYAKLLLKLIENDSQYLEKAASICLTAIYNDSIINNLWVVQQNKDHFNKQQLREKLLKHIDTIITKYEQKSEVSEAFINAWQIEKETIQRLAQAYPYSSDTPFFPCTPMFAHQFGISEIIGDMIDIQQAKKQLEMDESFLQIRIYFSIIAQYLVTDFNPMMMKHLFALLDKYPKDNIIQYGCQKILFQQGMLLLSGKIKQQSNVTKYFTKIVPFFKQYPDYAEVLCVTAFSSAKLADHLVTPLATVMEQLSRHLKSARFLEATAYIMGHKASLLLDRDGSVNAAKNILAKALKIYPDSDNVATVLQEITSVENFKKVNQCFKKQNLKKASIIVKQAGDLELTDYFFETIERWYNEIQAWDSNEKMHELQIFYQGCHAIDSGHPVTIKIGRDLKNAGLR